MYSLGTEGGIINSQINAHVVSPGWRWELWAADLPLNHCRFNYHKPCWGCTQACVQEIRRHEFMFDIGNRCVPKWLWLRILLAKKMSLNCLANQQILCLKRKQIYSRRSFLPIHCWGFEIFGRLIPKNEPAIQPHFVEYPTQTGHYLVYCFEVTAGFKRQFRNKKTKKFL